MSCKDLEAVMVEIAGKNGGFMRGGGLLLGRARSARFEGRSERFVYVLMGLVWHCMPWLCRVLH